MSSFITGLIFIAMHIHYADESMCIFNEPSYRYGFYIVYTSYKLDILVSYADENTSMYIFNEIS